MICSARCFQELTRCRHGQLSHFAMHQRHGVSGADLSKCNILLTCDRREDQILDGCAASVRILAVVDDGSRDCLTFALDS